MDRKFPSPAAYQTFLEAVQERTIVEKPGAYRPDMRKTLEDGLRLISQTPLTTGDASTWPRVLASLQVFAMGNYELGGARDQAMADNLKFLLTNEYKDAKVIVWAHNQHIMKHTDQLPGKSTKDIDWVLRHKMGTYFVQDPQWAKQTYVLGFASYQGTAGRLGTATYPIQAPDKHGLETWIPASMAYGFLDFTPYNKQFNYPATPFLLKSPWHYTIPVRIVPIPWNLVYDGLFFIRDMEATKEIK